MPYRKTPFTNGYWYHIFNRGVEKRAIFLSRWDYMRFLKTLVFYNDEEKKSRFSWNLPSISVKNSKTPLVSIASYCLMSNHYHFLFRQEREKGISTLMRKISNSYTKYFNTKNKRVGPLFQGQFKAVLITSDEHFLHTLRYIHLNPFVGNSIRQVESYNHPYSSYSEYLGRSFLCDTKFAKAFFKDLNNFAKFHKDNIDYARALKSVEHFEDD